MGIVEGTCEVRVTVKTDEQKREVTVTLPLYLAIEDGQLTGEAVATVREKVAAVVGGMDPGRQLRLVDHGTGEIS